MLADVLPPDALGQFSDDVQLPNEARLELLNFIARELPGWRNHPDRPQATAETTITEYLCGYLNSAARRHPGWRRLQFIAEAADEAGRGRKIDVAVKPCGAAIVIEGRRHSQFDSILPIECKRLPTPQEKDRDEREYVTSRFSTTGGIQRFKDGHHGSKHKLAGMIAYVQSGTADGWLLKVNNWIGELQNEPDSLWSDEDRLQPLASEGCPQFESSHARRAGLPFIQIRHLWISMQ